MVAINMPGGSIVLSIFYLIADMRFLLFYKRLIVLCFCIN